MSPSFVCAQESNKPQFEIWNASSINWGAPIDANDTRNSCEVHWLYDDVFDLSLQLREQNQLYFNFNVLQENTSISDFLKMNEDKIYTVSLVVGGTKHLVKAISLNASQIIITLSDSLNKLSDIREVERVLFDINGFVHHFLLENMNENVTYFDGCMESLGLKKIEVVSSDIKSVSDIEVIDVNKITQDSSKDNVSLWRKNDTLYVSDSLNLFSSYQGKVVVSKKNAYQRVKVVEQELNEVIEVNSNIEEIVNAVSKEPVVSSQSEQKYNLFQSEVDLNIEESKNNISKKSIFLGQVEKKQDVFQNIKHLSILDSNKNTILSNSCEDHTPVIQNLTRKLSILEREKEDLRSKLIGFAHNGAMLDISACNTQGNHVDESFYDEMIDQLENTINRLKAENELLTGRLLGDESF